MYRTQVRKPVNIFTISIFVVSMEQITVLFSKTLHFDTRFQILKFSGPLKTLLCYINEQPKKHNFRF